MHSPPERRQPCPQCAAPVYRLQRSYGVVAAYPCLCWLTPEDALHLVQAWRSR